MWDQMNSAFFSYSLFFLCVSVCLSLFTGKRRKKRGGGGGEREESKNNKRRILHNIGWMNDCFWFWFWFSFSFCAKGWVCFFLLQCSEWGVVIPKEILLTVWPHPPRFHHPSFSLQAFPTRRRGRKGHGWMVKSVVVVGGGGGWWGTGMVRRKRGSGEEIFLWKKSPWVVDCYFLFVGLLWCCSHLGTDCEDLGCCCCWNKSWRGRKWVVESNLVVVGGGGVGGEGGRGGEKEEENGRRIFWCMGCRIFGSFIEEFEA